MQPNKIVVSKQYSPYPAGRYASDGDYNGTKFRDEVLKPLLVDDEVVVIDIDGVAMLPSSFWEEIWGGLIRERLIGIDKIFSKFRIEATDEELKPYIEMAWRFAKDEAERLDG